MVLYDKLNHPTQVAKTAVYSAQAVLADSFFVSSGLSAFLIFSVLISVARKVWRCYVVWDKRWPIIVLPVIMLVGTAGEQP